MLKFRFITLFILASTFCQAQDSLKVLKFSDRKVQVESISVFGLRKTKKSIVLREIPIEVGDTLQYSELQELVMRGEMNIKNTNLFLVTTSAIVDISDNKVAIEYNLKENLNIYILPLFELSDRSFNEWWYNQGHKLNRVTYGVSFLHYNFTGNRDKLSLNFKLGFVPSFNFSYSKPYIDKKKRLGLSIATYYSKYRSFAFKTYEDKQDFYKSKNFNRLAFGASINSTYRKNLYNYQNFGINYSYNSISDSIRIANSNYLNNGLNRLRAISLTYTFVHDTRDSRQYPLSGSYFRFSFTKNGLGIFKDVDQTNIFGVYNYYTPLIKNFFLELSLRGKISFNKNQPYLYTDGIGYYRTWLRGYELYVIDGQDIGIFKSTIRYKLYAKEFNLEKYIKYQSFNTFPIIVYLHTFYDMGYARNYQTFLSPTNFGNKLLSGYGFGLDLVTWYNTNVQFNFAMNPYDKGQLFIKINQTLDNF